MSRCMHLSKHNSKQTVKLAGVILDVNHLLTYSDCLLQYSSIFTSTNGILSLALSEELETFLHASEGRRPKSSECVARRINVLAST